MSTLTIRLPEVKHARGWRRLPPFAVCDPEGTCTLR